MVCPVAPIRRCDRGAAAVEFALVLPVLMLIIFGIVDFGRMAFTQITLTQAAREGVRLSALGDTANVNARVQAAAQPITGVTGSVPIACPVTVTPTSSTTVTATYTFQFLTPLGMIAGLVGGSFDDSARVMTGQAVMRCNG